VKHTLASGSNEYYNIILEVCQIGGNYAQSVYIKGLSFFEVLRTFPGQNKN